MRRIVDLKHYTTICSSAPSELLSALALRHRHVLADRNRGIVLANLPLLDSFFERHADLLSWVRPTAGPIGFPELHGDRSARAFCEELVTAEGVLLLPGDVYDEPRHVRVGFGRAAMPEALQRLERFIDTRS